MSRRLVNAFSLVAAALAAPACVTVLPATTPATAAATAKAAAEATPREWEPWPPAQTVSVAKARPSGPTVKLEPKDGGWKIFELFEMISKTTGVSFLYDTGNATFKQAKVEFIGVHEIPESELFPWLQAVLSYRKLVLVPVGPKSADGKQQWFVMDQADPALKSKPVFIDEGEVLDYADRDGLYVVTTLRVRDTVEATRARNALSPLSTQIAGIGRIQDQGHFLVVSDFAPVVAAMKRTLDRINAETPPSAAPAPPTTPK